VSQSAEGYIQVPANQPGGTDVRQITGLAPQPNPDGTPGMLLPVNCEAIVLIDPVSFQPIQPMTKDQADTIISLLKRIAKAVEG
jgi:hypothetical protein